MRIRTGILAAVVAFGAATGAFTATQSDTRTADRRSAAEALVAFSDALRLTAHDDRSARILAGAELLRRTRGFIDGDQCLSGAYYAALYGHDSDLRAARDWLDSYLILATRRTVVGSDDARALKGALRLLEAFESAPEAPGTLAAAVDAVRATRAFAAGDVNLSEAVCRLGFALERPTRGWWFVPMTARHDARRAASSIRRALI